MAFTLPKSTFLALAAIGWADGALQRIEATGLLRAAKECGLEGENYSDVEKACKTKLALEDVAIEEMTQWEQVLTYALASWFAQLDGVVSTDEHTTLVALGDRIGLSKPLRVRAAAAAFDIACLPEGGRPDRYDFVKLVARLKERMPQLASG